MRPSLVCAFACLFIAPLALAQTTMRSDLSGPFATNAAKVQLNERGELARRVEAVLLKQARFLTAQLKPWEKDAAGLVLFKGNSGEGDIRSNAHLAYGLAAIYRTMPDDPFARQARDQSIAILRFLLPTHGAGGMMCNDGKHWHNQWQSAFWAHSAGKAAWLLWDDLDPKLQWQAARMITDEADRFVGITPPAQVLNDTKAEENAWDSMVIALAASMFPHHPHHEQWRETAIRWALSSFITSKDLTRTDMIDGKPLNQWVSAANIHDDFTLENHNRVHPDYMSNIRLNLIQKLDYDWGGNPAPAALRYNAASVYASLQKLSFPDASFVYPNGQDWQLHRADFFDVQTMMALGFNDQQAAAMMRICLETIEKMIARHETGGISQADEFLVPTTHTIPMELLSDAMFLLRQKGDGPAPVSEEKLWQALSGRHVFESGKFALLRTPHSVATFSWGRQVMGMVLPLRKDLLLTPNERSLIGMITMPDGKRDTPVIKTINRIDSPGALALAGIIDRAGGAIEQRFAFAALPDGRTIYADALRLRGPGKPTAVELGTLGVSNDKQWVYHNGQRTLQHDHGENVFLAADADHGAPIALSSPWYNLDGLGIVCLKTSGQQIYNSHRSPTPGRLEQLFQLNHVPSEAIVPGPDPFASGVLVFYPGQSVEDTRAAAGACKLEAKGDAFHFDVKLDDGRCIVVDLKELNLQIQ